MFNFPAILLSHLPSQKILNTLNIPISVCALDVYALSSPKSRANLRKKDYVQLCLVGAKERCQTYNETTITSEIIERAKGKTSATSMPNEILSQSYVSR